MIINLICGDNIFTSNDKQWNKICGIISFASQEFILDYKNNMLLHETNSLLEITNYDELEEPEEYNYYQKTLYEKSVNKDLILKSIDSILNDISDSAFCINPQKNHKNSKNFLKLYKKYLNLLTILGLSGIYSLNNNNDFLTDSDNIYGFYSIGNSYDIANAIDLVLPFVNNEYIEHLIFEVLMIFNHSVKNNLVISITNDTQSFTNKYKNIYNSLTKNIHKKGSLSYKLQKTKTNNPIKTSDNHSAVLK
jgi:hypothetical protein